MLDSNRSIIHDVEDRIRSEFLSYGFVLSEKLFKLYPFLTSEMLRALKSKVKCQLRLAGYTCKKLKEQAETNKKNRAFNDPRKRKVKIKKRKIIVIRKRKTEELDELKPEVGAPLQQVLKGAVD